MFAPEHYRAAGQPEATAEGRGANYFVRHAEQCWVLRHYRRGGLVGKVLDDRYLGRHHLRSRPWREWTLLNTLYRENFPVPRPVAARFEGGWLSYRADLITEQIQNVAPLSRLLSSGALPPPQWLAIGRCIRRFHRRGVCHADLNAHNILLDTTGEVFLLDFDRGEIRAGGRWQDRNLRRLQRSLLKLKSRPGSFAFSAADWSLLLDGYRTEAG